MEGFLNIGYALRWAIPPIVSLGVLLLLAWVAAPHWPEFRAFLGQARIDGTSILLASILFAGHYALTFVIWERSLRLAGMKLPFRHVANMWVPGLLARYIPGKVWANAIRLGVARRYGSPLAPVTGAIGWETLLALATGCAFALILFSDWPNPAVPAAVGGVLLTTAGMLLLARWLVGRKRLPAWLERFGLRLPVQGSGGVFPLIVLNLLAWTLYGTAHWALVRALLPSAFINLPQVAGAVAIAWVGGFLAIVMPAGLGVREGMLVVLLAPSIGTNSVMTVAAGSRLVSIGIDLTITAIWVWSMRRPQETAASPPSS